MKIKVREAEEKDFNRLSEIYAELDELHRKNHPELFIKPRSPGRSGESLAEFRDSGNKVILVAQVGSEVAGLAECQIREASSFPLCRPRKWVKLDSLAVKEKYQGCGVGTALFESAKEWAKSKGMDRIELNVYSFNRRAIEFYEKNGFRVLKQSMYLNL